MEIVINNTRAATTRTSAGLQLAFIAIATLLVGSIRTIPVPIAVRRDRKTLGDTNRSELIVSIGDEQIFARVVVRATARKRCFVASIDVTSAHCKTITSHR